MDNLEPFSIKLFNGKNIGTYEYKFEVGDTFFDNFQDSLIKKGDYEVNLVVDIRDRIIILDFEIKGEYSAVCDRCLVDIRIPSEIEHRILLKYGALSGYDEELDLDDVIYIEEGTRVYNVAGIIQQLIVLSKPMSNLYDCENDPNPKCDFKMLEYIDNVSEEVEEEEDDINPMWEDLKKIFLK